ncbi:hypothetical protein [Halpernia humi]|uniref:hypothetical protein n=1 Tax=Halpernia humi TaxID=493375 RepID=UPI0011B0B7CF|nr:hypothetical protein [Halpernia humi]
MIQFIDFELMLLRDYVNYVEEYFTSKAKELDVKFKELQTIAGDDPSRDQMENYDQSYYEVMLDNLIDDNFYIEEFTQRFRYSLIIQTYSFAEKYLSKIVDYFTKKNNTQPVNSKYLENLEKLISPNSIKKCEHYNFIVYFTDLRNCIVHSEGVFYSDMKNTKRLGGLNTLKQLKLINFKETKGLKRMRYKIIIDEKLFIDKSIDKIENFLREIDELLQTQY